MLRATRTDSCCRPRREDPQNPGTSGRVVTDAFISLEVTPGGGDQGAGAGGGQGVGGEGQSVAKADGQVCFTTLQCDEPQAYSVTLQLCALDPELVLIMKPSWCAIRDESGLVVGFTALSSSTCETSGAFALEVWMNIHSGASAACESAGGGSGHGYLLFPCISNVSVGGWSIQNGPIVFAFTGTTRRGSGWGRGPYNVRFENGAAKPLPCPVRPQADFVHFVTTFPPPEVECGIQPVDGGIPEAPVVRLQRGSASQPCLVQLRADNAGYGPLLVIWGDGTPADEVAEGQVVTHLYNGTCEDEDSPPVQRTIKVCDRTYPQVCTTHRIEVPLPPDAPQLKILQDPDDLSGKTVLVEVTLPSQAWCGSPDAEAVACACPGESEIGMWGIKVDWGEDGGEGRIQYIAVGPDCTAVLRHRYTADGRYPIKVCRNDIPTFCSRGEYIAGGLRPEVRFVSWSSSCGATIEISNHGHGSVSVDWGDGTPVQRGVAEGRATHAYRGAVGRSFTVRVCSEDIDGGCQSVRTPVCTGGGQDLVKVVATCDADDSSRLAVLVTADNAGHGTVTVTAPGATLSDSENAGDGQDVTKVVYPAGTTGSRTITARDPDEPEREGSATVTLPCTSSGLVAVATCESPYVVSVSATGGKFPMKVAWGDGSESVLNEGQAATHTYNQWKPGDPLDPARPAMSALGGPIALAQQTRVHQQIALYLTGSAAVYTTQVLEGGIRLEGETTAPTYEDRARRGDLIITRLSASGAVAGRMYARRFDHGAALGVEVVGSTHYLWLGCDAAEAAAGSDGYARKIARVPYTNNAVLDQGDPGVEVFDPRPNDDHLTASLDLDHNQIGVRYHNSGNTFLIVYKLDDFKARRFGSPVYGPVRIEVLEHYQAWALYGQYAYTTYGYPYADDNPPPGDSRFTVVDAKTGQRVGPVVPNNQFPDLDYREPEGIQVINYGGGPMLMWTFATGASSARRLRLFGAGPFAPQGPVSITVTSADGKEVTAEGVTEIPCTPSGEKPTGTFACARTANPDGLIGELTITKPAAGTVTVDWGDGSAKESVELPGGSPVRHAYAAAAGGYQVKITSGAQTSDAIATGKIPCAQVPPGEQVTAQLEACPDNPSRVTISYTNPTGRGVKIFWTSTTAPTVMPTARDTVTAPRDYPAGDYTITVVDVQDADNRATVGPFQIPCQNPGAITAVVSCAAAENPEGRRVELDVAGAAGLVDVDWGDGQPPQTNLDPDDGIEYAYTAASTAGYTVRVTPKGAGGGTAGPTVVAQGSPIRIPCT
ncbi:phage baseplate protein [Streptomyces noursei]